MSDYKHIFTHIIQRLTRFFCQISRSPQFTYSINNQRVKFLVHKLLQLLCIY